MEINITNTLILVAIPIAFIIIAGIIFFFDDLRKAFARKKKCNICGGQGYHKLSCPYVSRTIHVNENDI